MPPNPTPQPATTTSRVTIMPFLDDDDYDDDDTYDSDYDEDPDDDEDPEGAYYDIPDDFISPEAQAEAYYEQLAEFTQKYVAPNTACPVCAALLTKYHIPTMELWVWPGNWPDNQYYHPFIALDIYAVLDAPKGEVHPPVAVGDRRWHHVWIGEGEYREEKLIDLKGANA